MHSPHHTYLTPPRKRAASGAAELRSYQLSTTSNSISSSQPALDLHSVPDLDWGESPKSTPESTKYFPKTPSPHDRPSRILFIDEKEDTISTRPFKTPSRADNMKACKIIDLLQSKHLDCQPSELTYSSHKPAPLFNPSFYSFLPLLPSDISDVVKGHVSRQNFDFFQLSRNSNLEVVKIRIPMPHYALKDAKEPVRKKIKKGELTDETMIQHIEATAIESSQDLLQVETTSTKVAHKIIEMRSPLAGETRNHFSRILPWDTMDRLWEDPSRCVASLFKRPNERCSWLMKSTKHIKDEIIARLSELGDPLSLIAYKDYILELVEKTTCTRYHRKIAKDELKRLLDRYHERQQSHVTSKPGFTKDDIEAVQYWLKALITLPVSATRIETAHTARQTSVSKFFVDSADHGSQPVLCSFSNSAALNAFEKDKTTEKLLKSRTLVASRTVEVKRNVRESENHHVTRSNKLITTTCTIAIDHENDGTPLARDYPQMGTKSENLKMTHTTNTSITEKVETRKNGMADARCVETTKNVTIVQKTEQKSTFHPPSLDEIKFVTSQTNTVTLRRSQRIAARTGWLDERELETIHQKFSLSKKGQNLPIKHLLRQCLVNPLTKREYKMPLQEPDKPLEYPSQKLNYPGQGLIYMYWVPGNFGFVKIGKTSGESTAARLKKWESQCGHPVQELTRGEEGTAIQIPHVFRVEALVHAELKEVRIREECCEKCSKAHEEWFAVSPDHAMKVIRKWSDFTLKRPYIESHGVWRMNKALSEDDISRLCVPIEMPVLQKVSLPMLQRHTPSDPPSKKGKGAKKAKGRKKSVGTT